MRSIVKLSLLLSILFLFSSQAFASDSYVNNSAEKLESGVANTLTGWLELPKNIILTSQKEGPVYGITIGLGMGVMHSVGRTLVGALDAVTFLVPTKPSVNPPYIWQDFSRETSY